MITAEWLQVLVAFVAAGLAVVGYVRQVKEFGRRHDERREDQLDALRASVWAERARTYSRAADNAAAIAWAAAKGGDHVGDKDVKAQIEKERARFMSLYLGGMVVLEDGLAELAMVIYQETVKTGIDSKWTNPRGGQLWDMSLLLAQVLRKSLRKTWRSNPTGDEPLLGYYETPLREMWNKAGTLGARVGGLEKRVWSHDLTDDEAALAASRGPAVSSRLRQRN